MLQRDTGEDHRACAAGLRGCTRRLKPDQGTTPDRSRSGNTRYELTAAVGVHILQIVNGPQQVLPKFSFRTVPLRTYEAGVQNGRNRFAPLTLAVLRPAQPAAKPRQSLQHPPGRYGCSVGQQGYRIACHVLPYAKNDHAMPQLRNPIILALDNKIARLEVGVPIQVERLGLQHERMKSVFGPRSPGPDYSPWMSQICQHLVKDFVTLTSDESRPFTFSIMKREGSWTDRILRYCLYR